MPLRPVVQLSFLADYTYVDARGQRRVEQRIFDRMLQLISQAERLIVLDMFLFNDFAGNPDEADMRPLSAEVAQALIRRMQEVPELRVIFITDPINRFYGSLEPELFARLQAAGIEVVITELKALRASNPAWASLWRVCCQWFARSGKGWLPSPVGSQDVTLRSLLELLNFKANHRKTLAVDRGSDWTAIVTSANAHDASSAHSNIAIEFSGAAVLDLLATEAAVAAFSEPALQWPAMDARPGNYSEPSPGIQLQVLTEAGIRDAVLQMLASSGTGDEIDLAMFYLSHRTIIKALVDAHGRGVRLRVLLDPNEDAFGRKKNGVPNRSVAAELHDAGIEVRWCNTTGEQCHDKVIGARYVDGHAELLAGSANFTRRNLDDLNLETNVRVVASSDAAVITAFSTYFDRRWNNPSGESYSVPYGQFADEGWLRHWRYRLMEFTGLSTF